MHAEERDLQCEGVEALDALLEHVAAVARLAEENEVRGVHDRDVRVGVAHAVGEAARDGAVEDREELLALRGGHLVEMVARDERASLHAEVDGVEVHHESVAP